MTVILDQSLPPYPTQRFARALFEYLKSPYYQDFQFTCHQTFLHTSLLSYCEYFFFNLHFFQNSMVSALVNRFAEEPKTAAYRKSDPCEEEFVVRKNTVSL